MRRKRLGADLSRLTAFAVSREALRLNKEEGRPPPWTNDIILQTYRFTNIHRRDDRVSKWIDANICSTAEVNHASLAFVQFLSLCRWVNWPPTIAALMDEGFWPADHLDLRGIGNFIDKRCKSGEKSWTGAYMVRAQPGYPLGKGHFVATKVVGQGLTRAWPELEFAFETQMRRPVWKVLWDTPHWGSFMAGQVVDDLTWTTLLPDPRDNFSWAPQGPGSTRGFNRVLCQPLSTKHSEMDWCNQLQMWHPVVLRALGEAGMEYQNLTLMDLQNILCEFDKYERVRLGQGRPRATYKPETAF